MRHTYLRRTGRNGERWRVERDGDNWVVYRDEVEYGRYPTQLGATATVAAQCTMQIR